MWNLFSLYVHGKMCTSVFLHTMTLFLGVYEYYFIENYPFKIQLYSCVTKSPYQSVIQLVRNPNWSLKKISTEISCSSFLWHYNAENVTFGLLSNTVLVRCCIALTLNFSSWFLTSFSDSFNVSFTVLLLSNFYFAHLLLANIQYLSNCFLNF